MESQRHVTETERYGEGAEDRDPDPGTDDSPGRQGRPGRQARMEPCGREERGWERRQGERRQMLTQAPGSPAEHVTR